MNTPIIYTLSFLLCTASTALMAQAPPGPQTLERTLRTGEWSGNFTIAGFTGEDGFAPVVYDFAQRRDGTLLAAGMFQWSNGRRIGPLAERQRNGEWVSATEHWDREPPAIGFTSIATSDEDLVALSTNSGSFGSVPGEIWLDTGGAVRVIGRFNGAIRSMAWFDGDLWVAGFFQLAEGGTQHLAVWNGESWSAPPGGAPDRAVYRIAVSGESLLFAGDFLNIGGTPAQHIAEWNGSEWTAYDLADPIAVAHVYAVGRNDGGDLFAAGAITGGLVRWTGSAWEPVGRGLFDGRFPGVVSDFVTHQGDIYVTGCFTHANGTADDPDAVRAQAVARWTGSGWEGLDDASEPIGTAWFEWGVCGGEPNQFTIWDVRYQRLFSYAGGLWLGGMFPGAGGTPSQSIIALYGEEWRAVGETGDGLFGSAQSLAVGGRGNVLYAFGGITHAGEEKRTSGVFRYQDSGGWVAVSGPLPEGLTCSGIAVDGAGAVHIGCNTRSLPEQPSRPFVLRQSGDGWQQLAVPGVEGNIWDIRTDPAGRVWAAGGTRTGDASGSGFIARADAGGVTVVENGFNSMVFRLAFAPGTNGVRSPGLIAAGAFTRIGADSFGRIARMRGGAWEPLGNGLPAAVLALAWGESGVYASTEAGGEENPSVLLGHWNGSQWTDLATPENGLPAPREGTVYSFRDLLAAGRYVVAAGSIWPESGGGRNVWVYDGTRLSPLGGGVDAISVDSIALGRDGLWFGGQIAQAGANEESEKPSVGIAHFTVNP